MFELIYRYDPDQPRARRIPVDAHDAWQCLIDGNRAFSSLATGSPAKIIVPIDLEDIGITAPGTVPKQQPFAAVLGCSDARVPTELIFDRSCNELFVVRVAGNVLGQEQLGSLDYAIQHFDSSLKVIVVLGHSQCGAVTAAVDAFLTPIEYLSYSSSHHIRAILNSLFVAVRGAARALSVAYGEAVVNRSGYRAALIESSIIVNAALTASILQDEFGNPNSGRRVVFGVYDLGSRRVHVPLASKTTTGSENNLLDAPVGPDAFRLFAEQVITSEFIQLLLGH
jgi:carbonic anhydrase